MSDITAAIEARVAQYRDRLIEESRKHGDYWLTPEGRAEIHTTWDTEGDGNCVLPLLREVERLEAQAERAEQQLASLRERIEALPPRNYVTGAPTRWVLRSDVLSLLSAPEVKR